MIRQQLSKLEIETTPVLVQQTSYHPEGYEKPSIKRHAIIMTMAPQGSKIGHGLFPFATKRKAGDSYRGERSPYRRV